MHTLADATDYAYRKRRYVFCINFTSVSVFLSHGVNVFFTNMVFIREQRWKKQKDFVCRNFKIRDNQTWVLESKYGFSPMFQFTLELPFAIFVFYSYKFQILGLDFTYIMVNTRLSFPSAYHQYLFSKPSYSELILYLSSLIVVNASILFQISVVVNSFLELLWLT